MSTVATTPAAPHPDQLTTDHGVPSPAKITRLRCGGRVVVPSELIESPLSDLAVRAVALVAYRDQGSGCFETVTHMAKRLGVHRATLHTALSDAVTAGFLSKDTRTTAHGEMPVYRACRWFLSRFHAALRAKETTYATVWPSSIAYLGDALDELTTAEVKTDLLVLTRARDFRTFLVICRESALKRAAAPVTAAMVADVLRNHGTSGGRKRKVSDRCSPDAAADSLKRVAASRIVTVRTREGLPSLYQPQPGGEPRAHLTLLPGGADPGDPGAGEPDGPDGTVPPTGPDPAPALAPCGTDSRQASPGRAEPPGAERDAGRSGGVVIPFDVLHSPWQWRDRVTGSSVHSPQQQRDTPDRERGDTAPRNGAAPKEYPDRGTPEDQQPDVVRNGPVVGSEDHHVFEESATIGDSQPKPPLAPSQPHGEPHGRAETRTPDPWPVVQGQLERLRADPSSPRCPGDPGHPAVEPGAAQPSSPVRVALRARMDSLRGSSRRAGRWPRESADQAPGEPDPVDPPPVEPATAARGGASAAISGPAR